MTVFTRSKARNSVANTTTTKSKTHTAATATTHVKIVRRTFSRISTKRRATKQSRIGRDGDVNLLRCIATRCGSCMCTRCHCRGGGGRSTISTHTVLTRDGCGEFSAFVRNQFPLELVNIRKKMKFFSIKSLTQKKDILFFSGSL